MKLVKTIILGFVILYLSILCIAFLIVPFTLLFDDTDIITLLIAFVVFIWLSIITLKIIKIFCSKLITSLKKDNKHTHKQLQNAISNLNESSKALNNGLDKIVTGKAKVSDYIEISCNIEDDITKTKLYKILPVPDLIRTLDNCVYLTQNSKNIETVMSRLELALQKADELATIEKLNPNAGQISYKYFSLFLGEQVELLNRAIDRYYDDMLIKVDNLKSKQGKIKKIDKYIDNLERLKARLPKETQKYISIKFKEYLSNNSLYCEDKLYLKI